MGIPRDSRLSKKQTHLSRLVTASAASIPFGNGERALRFGKGAVLEDPPPCGQMADDLSAVSAHSRHEWAVIKRCFTTLISLRMRSSCWLASGCRVYGGAVYGAYEGQPHQGRFAECVHQEMRLQGWFSPDIPGAYRAGQYNRFDLGRLDFSGEIAKWGLSTSLKIPPGHSESFSILWVPVDGSSTMCIICGATLGLICGRATIPGLCQATMYLTG